MFSFFRSKDETVDVSTLSPTAETGSFFRTVAFEPAGSEDTEQNLKAVEWMEAVENPLSNKWRVFEVKQKPDLSSHGGSDAVVYDRRRTSKQTELTLDEALITLLQYEKTQAALAYVVTGDAKESFGAQHVEAFCLNEGRVPDTSGELHAVTSSGHVLTEGVFNPEMLLRALRNATEPKPQKPEAVREDTLSRLFKDKARLEDQDIVRFLEKSVERGKWVNVVTKVADVLNKMHFIQANAFETVQDGNFMSRQLIKGDKEYEQAIEDAKEALKENGVLDDAEMKAKFDMFFDQVQLVYEVAYAKYLYKQATRAKNPEAATTKLKEHVKYAEKYLRGIGGKAEDVKRMNGEIVSDEPAFRVDHKYRDDYPVDKLYSRYDLSLGSRSEVYYYPETLLDFMQELDGLTDKIDAEIAAEKKRIEMKKQQAEEQNQEKEEPENEAQSDADNPDAQDAAANDNDGGTVSSEFNAGASGVDTSSLAEQLTSINNLDTTTPKRRGYGS